MSNSMITRRQLIQAAAATSIFTQLPALGEPSAGLLGHGDFRYEIDTKWSKANPKTHPVNNCHEMVQAPDGRLFMITDQSKNNILIFSTDGELSGSWTLGMNGGHGLTLNVENETPYLYVTDTRGQIVKTDLDGKVVLTLPHAHQCKAYSSNMAYAPTETAIGPNGDIYVADGYGSQYILRFNNTGKYLGKFGGKSMQATKKGRFLQVHGVALDTRGPQPLLVCSARIRNEFQWFTLDGKFVKSVYLPGCYVSRPVIHGDHLYSGICFGTYPNDFRAWQNRGFVIILDANDKVVSAPGAIAPSYQSDQKLNHIYQDQPTFENCHDVCIDTTGNIYVCQWSAGKVYPYKLTKT